MMTRNLNVVMIGLREIEAMTTMPLLGLHLLKRSNNEDTEDDGQLGLKAASTVFPSYVFLVQKQKM